MAKVKSRVHGIPQWARPHEDAPVDLWPDISKLPTQQTVGVLVAARRSRPEAYLAVVNGLRWATTGDVTSAWSFMAVWVAMLAVVFAALTALSPWALIAVFVFFILFTVMLNRIAGMVSDHSDRKRHAEVWLAALEDANRRPHRRSCRWR